VQKPLKPHQKTPLLVFKNILLLGNGLINSVTLHIYQIAVQEKPESDPWPIRFL
jgi:hypothetical protein